ncbi:MAG: EAL domain-containing protein, partial [Candidatus Limnocylindria bacterium]
DAYRSAWLELGLTCAAFIPFGSHGVTHGLIVAGTTAPLGSAGVARWLPSLAEFSTIAAALLAPELSTRRELEGARAEIHRMIAEQDLATVFQPIVRLRDSSVIGYEALTRFADGRLPDHGFAIAESVGAGRELERAAVVVALREARRLPGGRWVSVNLSPSRLTEPGIIELLRAHRGRHLVVEVTERLAIDDYDAVRAALDGLGGSVEVAVDDAGAGFASLRHILELRPSYVKLDMKLVRGVEADPARQALIAGMVYFARQSGCHLIAEGIETEAERVALRGLGVPFGQGFRFGYPAPASEIAAAERAAAERAAAERAARPSARRRTAKVASA